MTDVVLIENLPEQVREAISLGVDRTLCPKCDGGKTREYSLSIKSDDITLRLKCYRASCGWYGIAVQDKSAKLRTQQFKPVSVFRDPMHELSLLIPKIRGYGINLDVVQGHGWKEDQSGKRLIMPVLDPYGRERGHITRTFDLPKRCYTFKATAQPWLDHWMTAKGNTTVIVEDTLSAARLATIGYNAVALLGTSITVDQAKEIHSFHGHCYIALDRDAFVKSIKLVKRHAHILRMDPVCLDQDIKNIKKDSDILKLFGDVHGRT